MYIRKAKNLISLIHKYCEKCKTPSIAFGKSDHEEALI